MGKLRRFSYVAQAQESCDFSGVRGVAHRQLRDHLPCAEPAGVVYVLCVVCCVLCVVYCVLCVVCCELCVVCCVLCVVCCVPCVVYCVLCVVFAAVVCCVQCVVYCVLCVVFAAVVSLMSLMMLFCCRSFYRCRCCCWCC